MYETNTFHSHWRTLVYNVHDRATVCCLNCIGFYHSYTLQFEATILLHVLQAFISHVNKNRLRMPNQVQVIKGNTGLHLNFSNTFEEPDD